MITDPYGQSFDLETKKWELLNPTYYLDNAPIKPYWGFFGEINGKLYNAFGAGGKILEWDVDYLR